MKHFISFAIVCCTLAPAWAQQPVDKDHAAKMERSAQLFKQDLRGVLTQRCLRCHGGKKTEAELDLHSRESLLKGGTSGAAVVPAAAGERKGKANGTSTPARRYGRGHGYGGNRSRSGLAGARR